jgi:hypothetical protein
MTKRDELDLKEIFDRLSGMNAHSDMTRDSFDVNTLLRCAVDLDEFAKGINDR